MNWRELAKFGSGVAAWEAVVHAALLLDGDTVVILGWTLTPTINLVQTIVPAAIALLLGWWAWRKVPRHSTE